MTVAANNARLGGTAVVCGAGIAGLVHARVLADFYDRVVVIERDELAEEAAPRRGVPQGNYLHTLLVGGLRILRELFPGFVEEMVTLGAHYDCVTSSRKFYRGNGLQPRFDSDLWTLICSRGMLEWGVRRRVLTLPNVQVLGGRRIVDLAIAASTSDDRTSVVGVRTQPVVAGGEPTTISGDLVLDATGRTSAGPKWLASLGYPVPEETSVNGFWGYACRNYRVARLAAGACVRRAARRRQRTRRHRGLAADRQPAAPLRQARTSPGQPAVHR